MYIYVLCYCSAISASLPVLGCLGLVCIGFRPQCTPSLSRRVVLATRLKNALRAPPTPFFCVQNALDIMAWYFISFCCILCFIL